MSTMPTLIVFSHLRWDFVYQRPQHLISRIARTRRVLFIEEPSQSTNGVDHWICRETAKNVTVCQPQTSEAEPGFNDAQNGLLRPMVKTLLQDQGVGAYDVWFYSPMALPLAAELNPGVIVYDCMDELSAFANAPAQLLERESELLGVADVVFTGGPSLYRAKKDRHPNAYCFSSSVDAVHFGQGCAGGAEQKLQSSVEHPRLGYFGVIDERFDARLLDEVARKNPGWNFSMVGPIVKIDPATLPRHENIRYYGQQSYEDLPQFLAGWDVCLLPFARNEATRFISPTKTLEYMAAERMIVSTPITDVAEPYGEIVFLGETPDEFSAACEQALNVSDAERASRIASMRDVLARTSWDTTAHEMLAIVDGLRTSGQRASSTEGSSQRQDRTDGARPSLAIHPRIAGLENGHASNGALHGADEAQAGETDRPVVVIGAGPTGLSAAYHLGENYVLLEANDTVGGWCRSLEVNGFTFDYAGHIMFSNDPYVHELYKMLLGDNVHWQDREAWVFSKNVYTRYPFQGALYGLPPDVITECIVGAVESRYGVPEKPTPPPAPSHNGVAGKVNGHARTDKKLEDCCADGVLESTAGLIKKGEHQAANGAVNGACHHNGNGNGNGAARPANFEEFIYKVWGRGIAKHFAIPYNRKLWATPLTDMETSWLGGRVPMPDLEEMIEGALRPVAKPMGPNARFGYPLHGGFQSLMDGFLPHVADNLRLETRVAKISPSERVVTLVSGEEIPYESLISTMPLPALVRSMGDEAPEDVQQAALDLRNVSVRCVHLGIGREMLTEKHWVYYPEETVFHRIFVQGNASPHVNPPGGFGLTCEITYSPHKPLPCDGEALVQRCIEDCIKVGIIQADDPIWATAQFDLPYAYVVYDHDRPKNVAVIRTWLAAQGIILAGRYSEWEYYNSDHAFLAGRKAAADARGSTIGTQGAGRSRSTRELAPK